MFGCKSQTLTPDYISKFISHLLKQNTVINNINIIVILTSPVVGLKSLKVFYNVRW